MHTVAIYLVDRAYGGPEEGGWWYDHGEPAVEYIEFLRGFPGKEDAERYATELNENHCRVWNKDRPSIGSMRSIGHFRAKVMEGFPRAWPEETPHYE